MKALSVEQSIFEGKQDVKKLFQCVKDHAETKLSAKAVSRIFPELYQGLGH